MNGEFPKFEVGENNISWTGSVSKVKVIPNWRWL
ncbi:phage tail protein [uncultured Clostridium sp.]|nr:phage tail protein [uncultured Clostridium sp.]